MKITSCRACGYGSTTRGIGGAVSDAEGETLLGELPVAVRGVISTQS
jgi:hypothetical protein